MKHLYWITLSVLLPIFSVAQSTGKEEIKKFQQELNEQYSNPLKSPLTEEGKKQFKQLDFFPIDLKYRVTAKFVRTPDEKPFKMQTTTDRLPVYVKYGEAHFEIDGKKCKLNIYQNVDLIKKVGYEDYLFVPYKDKTSGKESYGGGKYLDLRIPKGDKIVIDFNQTYNPYCAYNHKYSCPIPPKENTLAIAIEAGVKIYNGPH